MSSFFLSFFPLSFQMLFTLPNAEPTFPESLSVCHIPMQQKSPLCHTSSIQSMLDVTLCFPAVVLKSHTLVIKFTLFFHLVSGLSAPLKLRPYGAIQICLLLLLYYLKCIFWVEQSWKRGNDIWLSESLHNLQIKSEKCSRINRLCCILQIHCWVLSVYHFHIYTVRMCMCAFGWIMFCTGNCCNNS